MKTINIPRLVILMNAVVVLTFLSIVSIADASLIFSDGTFNNEDWSLFIPPPGNIGGDGTVAVSKVESGGNPDAYRRIINSVNGQLIGYHMYNDAIYNPSTQGAILSIDYYEDSILFDGFGQGQVSGLVLSQGGTNYISAGSGNILFVNQSTWTHHSILSLAANEFIPLDNPTLNPDFSSSGDPITFGFYRATSGGPYSIDAGIDNWSVEISNAPIPEPTTILLVGSGLVGLVGFRRKFKK
jgi:hypothetical protein